MSFFKDFGTDMPSDEEKQEFTIADEAEEIIEENIMDEAAVAEEAAQHITAEEDKEKEFFGNEVDEELLDMMLDSDDVEADPEVKRAEVTEEDKAAVTVITKGTAVKGDIESLGKITVSGTVTGNIMASEIYTDSKRIEGNLTSEGSVKIAPGTIIIGNLNGTSAVIAGAVKGEIDINGPVIIESTAIIKGNVKAKSVQMDNEAVLEGFCSLTYASFDIDNVFE